MPEPMTHDRLDKLDEWLAYFDGMDPMRVERQVFVDLLAAARALHDEREAHEHTKRLLQDRALELDAVPAQALRAIYNRPGRRLPGIHYCPVCTEVVGDCKPGCDEVRALLPENASPDLYAQSAAAKLAALRKGLQELEREGDRGRVNWGIRFRELLEGPDA